jgi:hypothetical protein
LLRAGAKAALLLPESAEIAITYNFKQFLVTDFAPRPDGGDGRLTAKVGVGGTAIWPE